MKEWTRKKLVYLKHNPQIFPKIFLLVTCVFFTFNLTTYSFAAVDIENTLPAVNLFIITLCSFMMVISFVPMRASLRKKPATAIITLGILVLQIVLQIVYLSIMNGEISALTEAQKQQHLSWQQSVAITYGHVVFLVLTLLSIVAMPFYARLLLKIKTAPPVDDAEELGQILEQEDLEELARLDG